MGTNSLSPLAKAMYPQMRLKQAKTVTISSISG
jgi:hypothetical protein